MHCLMYTVFTGIEPVPDKFIVVPFIVSGEPAQQGDQLEPIGEFDSLETARLVIPAGNVRLETNENEHPSIVESWCDAEDFARGARAIASQAKRKIEA